MTDAAGHTLLKPNGDINTDPKTGIPDATRFATLAGSTKPGGDILLFGKTGAYNKPSSARAPDSTPTRLWETAWLSR